MFKLLVAASACAMLLTVMIPDSAEAAKRRPGAYSHARSHTVVRHDRRYRRAVRPRYVVGPVVSGPAYAYPPSYTPAPPFPFFLIPGPWWLPASPGPY